MVIGCREMDLWENILPQVLSSTAGQNGASLQENHTHDLNKIGQRIESRYPLRPVWHAAHGSEQAAHQDEYHQEEKHDEHGLLHRGGIIGNNQSETRHRKNVDAREEIYQPQTA